MVASQQSSISSHDQDRPKLLGKIPFALFAPLAAPGSAVYLKVLLALLNDVHESTGLLTREEAVRTILEILESQEAMSETAHLLDEEVHFGVGESDTELGELSLARAGAIVRYLERCGWIRTEMQADFRQAFVVPDYAFRILVAIQGIVDEAALPLRGLICSIHDLLQGCLSEGSSHVRLPEAWRQAQALTSGLQELLHNIGLHLEKVLSAADIRDVLEQFFTSYRDEIVDKSYHQLRTTDHVSRFRPGILDAIDNLSSDENLEQAARLYSRQEKGISEQEAQGKIHEMLMGLSENVERMDTLLETIDTRHGQFVDAAVRAIERKLQANATTSGQTYAILKHLLTSSESIDLESMPVELLCLRLIDSQSPFKPRAPAEAFISEDKPRPTLSKEAKSRAREGTLKQMLRSLSQERIRAFASELLSRKNPILASEISIHGPDDLPMLIYLRSYGDGRLGYRATMMEPKVWVEMCDVGFNDFIIERVRDAGDSHDS